MRLRRNKDEGQTDAYPADGPVAASPLPATADTAGIEPGGAPDSASIRSVAVAILPGVPLPEWVTTSSVAMAPAPESWQYPEQPAAAAYPAEAAGYVAEPAPVMDQTGGVPPVPPDPALAALVASAATAGAGLPQPDPADWSETPGGPVVWGPVAPAVPAEPPAPAPLQSPVGNGQPPPPTGPAYDMAAPESWNPLAGTSTAAPGPAAVETPPPAPMPEAPVAAGAVAASARDTSENVWFVADAAPAAPVAPAAAAAAPDWNAAAAAPAAAVAAPDWNAAAAAPTPPPEPTVSSAGQYGWLLQPDDAVAAAPTAHVPAPAPPAPAETTPTGPDPAAAAPPLQWPPLPEAASGAQQPAAPPAEPVESTPTAPGRRPGSRVPWFDPGMEDEPSAWTSLPHTGRPAAGSPGVAPPVAPPAAPEPAAAQAAAPPPAAPVGPAAVPLMPPAPVSPAASAPLAVPDVDTATATASWMAVSPPTGYPPAPAPPTVPPGTPNGEAAPTPPLEAPFRPGVTESPATAAVATQPQEQTAAPDQQRRRMWPWLVVGLVVLALAAAAVVLFVTPGLLTSSQEPPPGPAVQAPATAAGLVRTARPAKTPGAVFSRMAAALGSGGSGHIATYEKPGVTATVWVSSGDRTPAETSSAFIAAGGSGLEVLHTAPAGPRGGQLTCAATTPVHSVCFWSGAGVNGAADVTGLSRSQAGDLVADMRMALEVPPQ